MGGSECAFGLKVLKKSTLKNLKKDKKMKMIEHDGS